MPTKHPTCALISCPQLSSSEPLPFLSPGFRFVLAYFRNYFHGKNVVVAQGSRAQTWSVSLRGVIS
jgi:hypothetical protein